jgi:hypothetical protein
MEDAYEEIFVLFRLNGFPQLDALHNTENSIRKGADVGAPIFDM